MGRKRIKKNLAGVNTDPGEIFLYPLTSHFPSCTNHILFPLLHFPSIPKHTHSPLFHFHSGANHALSPPSCFLSVANYILSPPPHTTISTLHIRIKNFHILFSAANSPHFLPHFITLKKNKACCKKYKAHILK